MVQSGLMTGFSMILGMVCIACALRDMLRQRREYQLEMQKESNVIYVSRRRFRKGKEKALCRF